MQLPTSLTAFSLLLPYYTTLATAASIPLSTRDAPSAMPRIASVSYSGNGCPSSSPGVERTGSGFGDVGFKLNEFEAKLPGIESSNAQCQVHLQSTGCTAGWQVGIASATIRGHLVLDPAASLDWYLVSYWSENAGTTSTISGTIVNNGNSRISEDVSRTTNAGNVAWSPCAKGDGDIGILNVSFRVVLDAPGKQYAYFGKDADVAAGESWHYVWRRC